MPKKHQVCCTLDDILLSRIDQLADATGISRSDIINLYMKGFKLAKKNTTGYSIFNIIETERETESTEKLPTPI